VVTFVRSALEFRRGLLAPTHGQSEVVRDYGGSSPWSSKQAALAFLIVVDPRRGLPHRLTAPHAQARVPRQKSPTEPGAAWCHTGKHRPHLHRVKGERVMLIEVLVVLGIIALALFIFRGRRRA